MYKRFCKSFDPFYRLAGASASRRDDFINRLTRFIGLSFGRRPSLTVGRFEKSSLPEPDRLDRAAPCTMHQPENEALAFVGKGQH